MSEPESKLKPKYYSRYEHGLDDKRRVPIPVTWRPEEENAQLSVVVWPQHQAGPCLRVLRPVEFEDMVAKVEAKPDSDPEKVLLRRHIGSDSDQLTVDKAGRIVIPDHMARAAGIQDKAVFAGCVDYFEIWSPSKYENFKALDTKPLGDALGKLG
jgi:MraZ protein